MASDGLAVARLGLARGELAGQVAVVSGAGRGIGRGTARALAWLGARVVVAEIDAATGEETCRLVAADGGQALLCPADVADEAGVAALAARTLRECERVDVLVNNAVLCPVVSLVGMDAAQWERVMAVNLRGTFLTCRAFLPAMLAQGSGVIVNMISVGAMPGLTAYYVSKQGIVGLSQALASEVGESGVRLIAFGPGLCDTPAIRAAAPDLAPRLGMSEEQFLGLSMHPGYSGLMPAGDAAAAAAYLVARLAGECHGEVVDGYSVLERAGYLRAASAATTAAAAPGAGAQPEPLSEAHALAVRLAALIAEHEREFSRMPIFVRPLARSGFRGKAGQGIGDWARTAQDLVSRLERVRAGDRGALAELQAALPRLEGLLGQLAAYFRGVPGEAARFSRDQKFLRQAAEIAADREATVRSLAQVLLCVAGE